MTDAQRDRELGRLKRGLGLHHLRSLQLLAAHPDGRGLVGVRLTDTTLSSQHVEAMQRRDLIVVARVGPRRVAKITEIGRELLAAWERLA